MTITLELTPELEAQLRAEAKRAGLDESEYVLHTLEERLRLARQAVPLSPRETELLQHINLGLSEASWQRYHELIAKRRAETLTPVEQQELIGLSDQIEEANVRRIEALIELAR
ncbi:MAG: hypothetical protein KIT87_09180 [Anaerolineae bacterium]|nr:hypothetical protein [Anaerolineae bacterium]